MAGRPAKHDFNGLKIGEKTLLRGKASIYPHQFANQYNKTGRKIKIVREGKKVYAERIK